MQKTLSMMMFFGVLSKMKTVEERLHTIAPSCHARCFSDCVFLFFRLDHSSSLEQDLFYFFHTVSDIVYTALSNGFLIRGGMCVGECWIDKSIVFGPGIIKAHYLEEKKANSAQIVMEENDFRQIEKYVHYLSDDHTVHQLFKFFIKNLDSQLYAFDSTGFIIDILLADLSLEEALLDYRDSLQGIKNKIIKGNNGSNTEYLLSKMDWIANRYNDMVISLQQKGIQILDSLLFS